MTVRVSCQKLQASVQEQTFQSHLSNPYCLILKLDSFAAFRYSQQPVGVSYFCMSFPYVHLNRVHTFNSFINNHVHHFCPWTTNVFHIHGWYMLLFHCIAPPLFQCSRLPGDCDSNGTSATNLDVGNTGKTVETMERVVYVVVGM